MIPMVLSFIKSHFLRNLYHPSIKYNFIMCVTSHILWRMYGLLSPSDVGNTEPILNYYWKWLQSLGSSCVQLGLGLHVTYHMWGHVAMVSKWESLYSTFPSVHCVSTSSNHSGQFLAKPISAMSSGMAHHALYCWHFREKSVHLLP